MSALSGDRDGSGGAVGGQVLRRPSPGGVGACRIPSHTIRRRRQMPRYLPARMPADVPQKPGIRAFWAAGRGTLGPRAKRARGPVLRLFPDVAACGCGSRWWLLARVAEKRTARQRSYRRGLLKRTDVPTDARRSRGAYGGRYVCDWVIEPHGTTARINVG
jgi:hypothetical protein